MQYTSKLKRFLGAGLLAMSMAAPSLAWASDKLILATGDLKTGSTYGVMGEELVAQCGKDDFQIKQTSGGTENRQSLVENKINLAFLQSDMLEFTKRNDAEKTKNIRTLIPLHREEIHVIVRGDVKKEGGYVFGIMADSVVFDSMSKLAGRPVGAVGGSFDTASVISAASGLNFKPVRMENNDQLKQALLEGKLDAAIVVAGAPSKFVATLPASFRLLPLPADVTAKLVQSGLYSKAKVSYENLRANGLDTVAVQSVIATRVYRSQEMIKKLKAFRECFYAKLGDIQDARGTHPKWQDVDPDLKTGWQWYEF